MSESSLPLFTFHLTGQISGEGLFDVRSLGLRPALFSAYGDLSKLRYDYPVVLIRRVNGGPCLRSLSEIFTEILSEFAPRGGEGERLRKHLLRLESEIRALAGKGRKASLHELWEEAAANLRARTADENDRKALDESLSIARNGLTVDGDVTDYDDQAPARCVTHAWATVQEEKASNFSTLVNELTLKLSNILKADTMKSATAFGADTLKQTVGSSYEAAFDFEAMSDILGTALVDGALPEKRRQRILSVLTTLKKQTFFPSEAGKRENKSQNNSHASVFDSCAPAMEAFRQRLPKMVDFVKAITIARLEIEGSYKEKNHDSFFRHYDERYLETRDLALFPYLLVRLCNAHDAKSEKADLIEIMASGLPIKVLVQNDDILGDLSVASGRLSFGVWDSQIASMALGVDGAFVLQASGADLCRLRDSLHAGLTHPGPALFSVFSGAHTECASNVTRNVAETPSYLRAAAATEARAFPIFVRDPAAGEDWETRFSLHGNPQPEMDWPVHRFDYEGEALEKITEDIAFTFVDFAAVDERYAGHFAAVPHTGWQALMVPVNEFMELDDAEAAEKVPYILMVDDGKALYRVIVRAGLIQAARRCREMWRSIRELGGIDNSHTRKALAEAKEIWERQKEQELAALKNQAVSEAPQLIDKKADAIPTAEDGESVEVDAEEAVTPPSDEPYIETARCTTCDECTVINDEMFAYDDNKQAFIADPRAGTYRQLVEAAESCQVAIIHPGKPLNPDEPNLDELLARAEAFI